MRTSAHKLVAATAASAILSGGLIGLSATPASAHPDCDDVYKRKYSEMSSRWYKVVASGTIDNRRSSASQRESISAELSASLKGSVSGEIGGGINLAVGEINAKFGVTVEGHVSISRGKTTILTYPQRPDCRASSDTKRAFRPLYAKSRSIPAFRTSPVKRMGHVHGHYRTSLYVCPVHAIPVAVLSATGEICTTSIFCTDVLRCSRHREHCRISQYAREQHRAKK